MPGRHRAHVSRDRDRQHRRRQRPPVGGVVAGRRAVTEAIRAGTTREILVVESAKATQGLRAVLDAAHSAQIPVHTAPRAKLDALASDHQGVVARTVGPRVHGGAIEVDERGLAAFSFASDSVVVVLDGIVDPQNLGAAARSAEAVGAAMLVSRTRRGAEVTPAAMRASAGALAHLPHARVANIARALARLQDAGFWIVGLDGGAETSIYDEPCSSGRLALVIGSEGEGMARLTRERCDALVGLPMRGHVSSLNASASLAATLYAYVLPSRG